MALLAGLTGIRNWNVFGSKTWSGWYFVGLLSRVLRNCLANCKSPISPDRNLRSSSSRRRACARAKVARLVKGRGEDWTGRSRCSAELKDGPQVRQRLALRIYRKRILSSSLWPEK